MSGSMKWRVLAKDLRAGFKVKTSSAPFQAGGQTFCLDVYLDGWGDDDKDQVACYVRYVGRSAKVLARASISLANGPTWTAEDDCLYGRVADQAARTRAGTRRFLARNRVAACADAAGYLTFSASVDLSRAKLRASGHVDLAPSSAAIVEEMSEDEIARELEKVDREEIQGLSDPKTTLRNSGLATQAYRNTRFGMGVMPIVWRYLRLKRKVGKMRKKLKPIDPASYYDERTTMWDEEHEQEAKAIRKLFNQMGGLYNKLAQDFATRDGLLPQAWVDEMKHSFEEMPPRPWATMKKCLLDGLVGEKVPAIRPDLRGLDAYFAAVDEKPLAAASIGQVHVATAHGTGEKLIVKAIYPEIRKYLVADLINARFAASLITDMMDMPVKGTIDAIMDEQVTSFPRELDLRIEARHLRKSRLYFHRHGLAKRIAIPIVVDELTSSAVLTQTFLRGRTLSGDTYEDPAKQAKAIAAVKDVALGIGVTLFRERFFHSDPHPGNIMLLGDDYAPGLIDFGQCTTLTKEQVRTVCHVVILLRTRSPTLIDKVLAAGDFDFNTEDPEMKMALMYYFFDSSQSGGGAVRPEAMEFLKDAMQHNPSIMPVLTDTPREMVFYGRVCGTLRKCFELLKGDVSVISLWYLEARSALKKINDANPDTVSTTLLLLPEDPDGLAYLVERLPTWTTNAIKWTSDVGDRIAKIAGAPAAKPLAAKSVDAAAPRSPFPEPPAPESLVGRGRRVAALGLVLAGLVLFAEAILKGAAALGCLVAFLVSAAYVVGWRPPVHKLYDLAAPLRLLFPDTPLLAAAPKGKAAASF